MAFTIDVREDGTPVRWTLDPDGGATPTADPDYEPTIYAAARDDREGALAWLGDALADDPKVARVERTERRRSLRAAEPSPMLAIGLERLDEVRQVARGIRQREHETFLPGTFSLYDVDLDPGFRYVLDRDFDPAPDRDLVTMEIALPEPAIADGDVGPLRIDGEPAVTERVGSDSGTVAAAPSDATAAVADAVDAELAARDPDVLLLSSGEIVPLLADAGVDLGRRPGFSRLASESTYVSYGQVGYSPARYDVPGRALIDRSNSFLLGHSALAGLLYFVDAAGKPLQALAKDSIGGVLTAIEIRAARRWDGRRVTDSERADGVPAPWQKRQTEDWKSLETLHTADRGGFTFQPEAAVHEDVHELDFASLYPNVICEYDVSPDTVCCDCCDGADVPELGYSICDDREGFLGAVLAPLIERRGRGKRAVHALSPENDARQEAAAVVEAIKWVLVSCFGYQGYRHAKFGRIETHEAINAYAREIMLTAKTMLETAGWRIVHGIVDSLWVTPAPGREQRPIREVATEITDEVDVRLEYEGRFDWVAFCPRKRASGAALMRYFGRWADETVVERGGGTPAAKASADADATFDDRYKRRGIEVRQRSTCPFVADVQRDLLRVFDRERAPEPVVDRLQRHCRRLRAGDVDPADLAITQRISKPADEYEQATRAKAALERAEAVGVPRSPGQSVEYVVVDDGRTGPERVRLAFEIAGDDGGTADGAAGAAAGAAPVGGDGRSAATDTYDPAFYADRLVRACESLVAPLGWSEGRIRSHLADDRDATLSSFAD